jgi:hypothetical protein
MKVIGQRVKVVEISEQELAALLHLRDSKLRLRDVKVVVHRGTEQRLHFTYVETVGYREVSTSYLAEPAFDLTKEDA